jgi:hypothetical protein
MTVGFHMLRRIANWPALLKRAGFPRLRCWWGEDRCMQALANLDDDQLSDLSELGQHLRRKALRGRQTETADMALRQPPLGLDPGGREPNAGATSAMKRAISSFT